MRQQVADAVNRAKPDTLPVAENVIDTIAKECRPDFLRLLGSRMNSVSR